MQQNSLKGNGEHTIHIRISAYLFEKLKSLADNEARSLSGMVKYIVTQYINKLQ